MKPVRKASQVVFAICCAFVAPALCFAEVGQSDQWSEQPKNQHPPTAAYNRIIRWCSSEGKSDRFASANITLKGYEPCGELNIPITCDPSGKRLISKDPEVPYTYKDCGVGPRIQVVHRKDLPFDENGNPIENASTKGENVDPLSTREAFDLVRDVKKAEKAQSQDLEMQLQKVMDSMLSRMITGASLGGNQRQSRMGKTLNDRQIDQLMRYIDPQQQQQFKQLLKGGRP